ncbi:unnamed protein product [Adineta ricciae]|uniref:SMP-LTD domain-containing protein n=2 Tax=Adineta ricciae TaxID=249248 RepID=A0A814UUP7_ADIRI|nr:unnamed protein product [Adineta ricciae]
MISDKIRRFIRYWVSKLEIKTIRDHHGYSCKRVWLSMDFVVFFSHLFICLIGILISIPFAFLLTRIFTLKTTNKQLHRISSLLFSFKAAKSDILTIPSEKLSCSTVWMFGVIVTRTKVSNRDKPQLIYLKLYNQYLLIHFTSKHLKNINQLTRHRVTFSEVMIFDLFQAKIHLKLPQVNRSKYWSIKSPIVITHLHLFDEYGIEKRKKSSYHSQKPTSPWLFSTNSTIQNTTTSFIDLIEHEFHSQKHISSDITKQTTLSSTSLHDKPWRGLLKTFTERISLFSSKQTDKQNEYFLSLINFLISRCTINFYENPHVRHYLKSKLGHELKHLKLPYYIHWIRLSHFSFDNTYPTIENIKQVWFNQNGLWTSMNLTYQGNISIEFTIQLNLLQKQVDSNTRSLWFQRIFHFHDDLQVLEKVTRKILTITINIRSINGVLLLNIPSPPSDRLWFGFEDLPEIDFDVDHQHIPSDRSQSSLNAKTDLNKQLNQLQKTINHLLSQWIKKQIYKECVLPNMYDVCMKWCNNPLEENESLYLKESPINHLRWLNDNDSSKDFHVYRDQSAERVFLIAYYDFFEYSTTMSMSSPQIIFDEARSLTPDPTHPANRTPRRSHVSISSSKRASMNVGASNSNKTKQGMFRRAVPQMPRVLAFICFALNLVLPGTGTLVSAFAVFCCGKHDYEKNIVAFFYNILAAILQISTIFLLVGWIWSIRWGILFVQLSSNKNAMAQSIPFYVRRQSSVDTHMQPFLTQMVAPRVPPLLEDKHELDSTQ